MLSRTDRIYSLFFNTCHMTLPHGKIIPRILSCNELHCGNVVTKTLA
nr:MAG TPA: hypothetical protein [Bacteriophage sp.]